jgi:hypothetical protein
MNCTPALQRLQTPSKSRMGDCAAGLLVTG